MKKHLLTALLGATALAGSATAAQAQVQTPGWFGALDGLYIFRDETGGTREFAGAAYRTFNPGDGWGGAALLGYRFMGNWDVALGGRYIDLSKGRQEPVTMATSGGGISDAKLFTVDGDVGYTFAGMGYGIRPFVGVRYQHWRTKFNDIDPPVFASTITSWGIGPRIGADATVRLFGPVSMLLGVDAALLFGKIKDSKNAAWIASGDFNGRDSRTFWDVGGKVALDWEVSPLVHLVAGYKGEWFDGINYTNLAPNTFFGPPSKRAGELLHGPFVRIAYNMGVPGAPPAPAVVPPVMAKSFIVFFDFDRSNLTPTALGTIKQAADAAKAGKSARVNVTGHADKSGADQYNMALSLRRANTVKDELVRQGVPAASIVVVGRGESQPLVPTADGVKEPQNRRVEIVLN